MKEQYIRIGLFKYAKTPVLPNLLRNITLTVYFVSSMIALYFLYLSSMNYNTRNGITFYMFYIAMLYWVLLSDSLMSTIIVYLFRHISTMYYIIKNNIYKTPIPYKTTINIYKLDENINGYTKKTRITALYMRLLLFVAWLLSIIGQILYNAPITYFLTSFMASINAASLCCDKVYYRIINNIFGI